MMRRLILMRHAKSDWPAGVPDFDRPLAARGRQATPRMGRMMQRNELRPDHVIVSAAQRTRQTYELLAPFLPAHSCSYEKSIYEAPPTAIIRVVSAIAPEITTVMIIGHNPGLAETLALLAAEQASPLWHPGIKFPTAALAVLEFDAGTWQDAAGQKGRLQLFVTPRALDHL